jgi:hypothetical protein
LNSNTEICQKDNNDYQDDFFTPGILPSLASSLKQILQRPKSRMNALPRPHLKHRFVARVENFGFFAALASTDVFAI